ncbi:signal peptidase II [Aquimarina spongiae]|uniref:Lipoprotein signal peptidase n=1 Tax=Aquimarina spongiae TaxID=570521 RepID=A0A1M6G588_9FLAO|nr:signal peptidase II [Aquimarina spongiae]SHJ05083.1 signal peptidase II [Aquimarina spongiae]
MSIKIAKKLRITFILALVLLNVSCDQVLKNVVRQTIAKEERIHVIKDSFVLTKVENEGAAWSVGSDLSPLLKIIFLQIIPTLVLVFLLRHILIQTKYKKETVVGFAFIIGGGIGNLFDRIVHNSVTDFLILDLGLIKTEIFNLADVSIMVGSILVLFSVLVNKDEILFKK